MKKLGFMLILIILLGATLPVGSSFAIADNIHQPQNYVVYDENDNILLEREDVAFGDKYIDRYFDEYEIYLINHDNATAKAKYVRSYQKPTVSKNRSGIRDISSDKTKKIALYMTHNDESYLIGDGYDSVYGPGGIHDIAHTLKNSLRKHGVQVELDETLHIPHNSAAYSRSAVTAEKLMRNKPDAIFDIHRDGSSRQYYVANVNGKETSKIRIVLGQSNANKDQNLQFALYLLSVAEVDYPWLFQDIYWGKGHYNQSLSNKALLFEMGTHTIEKDYVQEAAIALADVLNTTLYQSTVDENDNIIINPSENETNNPTINENMNNQTPVNPSNPTGTVFMILIPIFIVGSIIGIAIFVQKKKSK